jgi:mannose-6-phosphate isomerase-like protein (cupin superfamily)
MESYLGGALTVEQVGGDSAAGIFRASDARGSIAWLARGGAYQYLHAAEFAEAGVRRGFHVHANHTEHFYVFLGSLRLLARKDVETVDLVLSAGDMAVLGPGVAHGLTAREPTIAVILGHGADPIHDVQPVPDLG